MHTKTEFADTQSIVYVALCQLLITKSTMIGTIVNTATIIVGAVIGAVLKKGIKDKYRSALFTGLGLCTMMLGANATLSRLPDSEYPVLFILSIAIGGLVGTILHIDESVKRFAEKHTGAELAKGLTTGCMLYCIGTFSMVGPMLSALNGDNTFLYTNATLDIVTSMVLATTYGIGMVLAAPVLFLWQGMFYCIALGAQNVISTAVTNEISIVGGVLILSTGFSLLNIKDLKTLNFLPALLVPVIFYAIKGLFF